MDEVTEVEAALALLTRVRADREAHRMRAEEADARTASLAAELAAAIRRSQEAEQAMDNLQRAHERIVREWTEDSAAHLREFEKLRDQV